MRTSPGTPLPLGATLREGGVNFSLFSKHATKVTLCLFEPGAAEPCATLPLQHKTGDLWHLFVEELPHTLHYAYQVDGPKGPTHYFNPSSLLVDPYAKRLSTGTQWGKGVSGPRGLLAPSPPFDWEGDRPPHLLKKELILYEMHVRGFTQGSGLPHEGTFLAILEKLPYLKELGVNALELMPLHEFDEMGYGRKNPLTQERLCDYWGYSPLHFFGVMHRYGSEEEFKLLIRECHKAGIEVFVDVVFNHTGEGNQHGPSFSFKGIDSSVYYLFDNQGFCNFSGCGNTLNCNHAVVSALIVDVLRYMVTEFHVDGFRFDLASILTRNRDGRPLDAHSLVTALSEDPLLADRKLIAEAWDAAGLYQLGGFPARWSEWNGAYRDDVREFLKGSAHKRGVFATRLAGSQDIYWPSKSPLRTLNFITAHDGFTLKDLVSYNEKHNEANGEDNRDGASYNASWNCGAEGPTEEEAVLSLRARQMRNHLLALFTSQGIPMLLMGDEVGQSRSGNNNTWCQDNALNWFPWNDVEKEKGLLRFTRLLIALRKSHAAFKRPHFLNERDVSWYGIENSDPQWDKEIPFVALVLTEAKCKFYLAFHVGAAPQKIHLPPGAWKRLIDTSLPSPQDFVEGEGAPLKTKTRYLMAPYSAILLRSSLS